MTKRTPRFSITVNAPAKAVKLMGGYDGQWRKLRNRRLDAEPLCRHCTERGLVTQAVEVDHIKPKALGGLDEWDNTQPLCRPCHQAKTRNDIQRIRRGW